MCILLAQQPGWLGLIGLRIISKQRNNQVNKVLCDWKSSRKRKSSQNHFFLIIWAQVDFLNQKYGTSTSCDNVSLRLYNLKYSLLYTYSRHELTCEDDLLHWTPGVPNGSLATERCEQLYNKFFKKRQEYGFFSLFLFVRWNLFCERKKKFPKILVLVKKGFFGFLASSVFIKLAHLKINHLAKFKYINNLFKNVATKKVCFLFYLVWTI